jgi:iron(III) transport system substrate-binding protein
MFQPRDVLVLAMVTALCVGVALTTGAAVAAEVVVVYTARHYGQEPVFEAFTKQTGIEMQSFDGSPPELFERLQAEGDKTLADVLISVDAGDLWNAAQAGLLAKIDAPELQANIPARATLRTAGLASPSGLARLCTIPARSNPRSCQPMKLSGSQWKNRLCLRSSNHIYNQSLLATMIKRFGRQKSRPSYAAGWPIIRPDQ